MRDKKEVQKLVNLDDKKPFVYSSGRYDKEFAKTTVAFPLTAGRNGNVLVYDLRYDPAEFVSLGEKELHDRVFATWERRKDQGFVKIPVKELQYNRTPAVAPLGVLNQEDGWQKIALNIETIERHKKTLISHPEFAENMRTVYEAKQDFPPSESVEGALYDGFLSDRDRLRVETVRNADEKQLADFHPEFVDERLAELLLHYKARSFPNSLSAREREAWEAWRAAQITKQMPAFMKALSRVAARPDIDRYMIEELKLWAESIMPDGG